MLNVHGVLGNGDGHDGSKTGTNVMVIIGATDDRIAALRRGNAPEVTVSASSKRPTEADTKESSDDHSA